MPFSGWTIYALRARSGTRNSRLPLSRSQLLKMKHVKSEKLLHTFLFCHRQVVQVINNTSHQAQLTGPFLDLEDLIRCEIYATQERKQAFFQ